MFAPVRGPWPPPWSESLACRGLHRDVPHKGTYRHAWTRKGPDRLGPGQWAGGGHVWDTRLSGSGSCNGTCHPLAEPGRLPFVRVCDGLQAGYLCRGNFHSTLAMGAAKLHLVNRGPSDPAVPKAPFRKAPAGFHDSLDAVTRRSATTVISLMRCRHGPKAGPRHAICRSRHILASPSPRTVKRATKRQAGIARILTAEATREKTTQWFLFEQQRAVCC